MKPKLLVTAQQHRSKLVAMRQGAPYGAHVKPSQTEMSQTRPFGSNLFGFIPPGSSGGSRNSTFVSVEEHAQYSMAVLMLRDAPSNSVASGEDDIVSIHDDPQSDIEMESDHEQPEQHSEDSSPDSGSEGGNNPSGDSDMESDHDEGSGHHSDSSSGHNSNPRSNPGSGTGLSNSSESRSDSSDDHGGDFTDMFQGKERVSTLQRSQNPGHSPVATAGPGRQRIKNGAIYHPQKICPIRTNQIGKRRNPSEKRLPPRAVPNRVISLNLQRIR